MLEKDGQKKIFIVGVQRSGTTLLRSVLHSHPDICVGYECAFYKLLFDIYPNGISVPEDLDGFLDSLFAIRRFEYWNLDHKEVKDALLVAGSQKGSLTYPELIETIGMCLRDIHKPAAQYIGYKNPNGIFHCAFIFKLFPEAKILHISRDPRGVLASEKKKSAKLGKYDPSHMIWTVAQRYKKMRAQHEKYKDDPRYIQIWYEDLVGNFETTTTQIMKFLNLEPHENLLDYHLEARKMDFTPEKERWQHSKTLEAPDRSRTNAFVSELTNLEISTLEAICGNELRYFGLRSKVGLKYVGFWGIGKLYCYKGIRAFIRRSSKGI